MCITRLLILSAIAYNAVSTDKAMKLEREWMEQCMKNKKCPVPGLKSHKSGKFDYEGIDCIDGLIDLDKTSYPCNNVKLLSYVTLEDLGSPPLTFPVPGTFGSDVWGYTDRKNKRLYGLTCQMDGASIVDVTDPTDPIPIAFIPSG